MKLLKIRLETAEETTEEASNCAENVAEETLNRLEDVVELDCIQHESAPRTRAPISRALTTHSLEEVLREGAKDFGEEVEDLAEDGVDEGGELAEEVANDGDVLGHILDLANEVSNTLEEGLDLFVGVGGALGEAALGEAAEEAFEGVRKTLEGTGDFVEDGLDGVLGDVGEAFEAVESLGNDVGHVLEVNGDVAVDGGAA